MHLGGPAQLRERRGQPHAPSAQLWWLLLDKGDWQPPAACSAVRCGPRTLETSRRNGVGRPQKFEPVGPHTRQPPTHVSTSTRESARGQGKALRTVNHVDCYDHLEEPGCTMALVGVEEQGKESSSEASGGCRWR